MTDCFERVSDRALSLYDDAMKVFRSNFPLSRPFSPFFPLSRERIPFLQMDDRVTRQSKQRASERAKGLKR